MPCTQITPPLPAARYGDPTALWESRISGYWSHALFVLNVAPEHSPQPITGQIWDWGSWVWARNVTTGDTSTPILVRDADPHVVMTWAPASEFTDGDLVQIMAEPHAESAGLASVWVNSAHMTVATSAIPAVPTPSDPPFVPPDPGWGVAEWGIDNWSNA